MAISWITALKIIPWSDVLESAPHIVKAAKHLFSTTKVDRDAFTAGSGAPADDDIAHLNRRIRMMEAKITELREEQKSSAELIKSLAEQNAYIVQAIEVLRVRLKMLFAVCVLLLSALVGLVIWLAR
jgi:hypothetical protein